MAMIMNESVKYSLFAVSGIFLIYLVWRMDLFKDESTPGDLFAGDVEPDDDHYLLAQTMHEAMRQCWRKFGIDEIFQTNAALLQSDEDFKRLFKAFGVRGYDKCVAGLPDWMYIPRDLWQWMAVLSDEDERARINDFFIQQGITFRI